MSNTQKTFILVALLLGVPALALPHTTPMEREQNRAKLQQLRKEDSKESREYLAHLYHQSHAFLALPAERREQVRQLDRELHELPPAYRQRLQQVMKKYVLWLHQLTPAQRQQIEQADGKEERLQIIKQMRREQWLAALPKKHRDTLAVLQGAEWDREAAAIQQQEFRWRIEWKLAFRHWEPLLAPKFKKVHELQMPDSFDKLSNDARIFAKDYLRHWVPAERWDQLEKAQGQWPWFPYLLVKLADDYPLALPPANSWPLQLSDLPPEIDMRLRKAGGPNYKSLLESRQGKWPDFAAKVAELMERPHKYELWPTQFKELSQPVRAFLENELKPVLTPNDRALLNQSENSWPQYPQTIQQLAKKYYLSVPWRSIPDPPQPASAIKPWPWDSYRIQSTSGGEG
jgi:hypothetical protein